MIKLSEQAINLIYTKGTEKVLGTRMENKDVFIISRGKNRYK